MKITFLTLCLLSISIGYAQYTQIPDPYFEEFLISKGLDDVLDGQVLTANINGVTQLYITTNSNNITDVTGIEGFVMLEHLVINYTGIVNLDLTGNVHLKYLSGMQNTNLINVDLTQSTDLTHLFLQQSSLLTLDITQNTELTDIILNVNQLTELNLSQNPELIVLSFQNNQLTELDLSQNINLRGLFCDNNNIISLDLTLNNELEHLSALSNSLTHLDIRNGANTLIYGGFITSGNPDLQCILVDDVAYSTANWTNIDPGTTFVESQEECDALSVTHYDETAKFIHIFPNPAHSFFVIAGSNPEILNVSIYNASGKLIRLFDRTFEAGYRFDVSSLSNGVYFVTMEIENQLISRKLLVKN